MIGASAQGSGAPRLADAVRFSGVGRYLVAQILGPLAFVTTAFTAIFWLRGSLQYLDLVINRGQSAATFAEFTVLILPTVVLLALPIALVLATLFTVHRLHNESELVVLWASGLSRLSVARAVMVAAGLTGILSYVLALWISPLAQNHLKDRVFEIRGDLAATVLQEGTFNSPIAGLTVYIRERKSGGELRGLLVHDSRVADRQVTYMAESGLLVRTADGPRLIMFTGNVQQVARETGDLSVLDFERYVFDLSTFSAGTSSRWRKPEERGLDELFHPSWGIDDQNNFDRLIAEGHKRLTGPLYVFALPLLALSVLLWGEFSRRGLWVKVALALALTIAARVVGLGLDSLAVRDPRANLLLYLWPVLVIAGSGFALTDLAHDLARAWRLRLAPPQGEGGPA